jgi:hypothetical protein
MKITTIIVTPTTIIWNIFTPGKNKKKLTQVGFDPLTTFAQAQHTNTSAKNNSELF